MVAALDMDPAEAQDIIRTSSIESPLDFDAFKRLASVGAPSDTPSCKTPLEQTPATPSETPQDPSQTPSTPSGTPQNPSATPQEPSGTPLDSSRGPQEPLEPPQSSQRCCSEGMLYQEQQQEELRHVSVSVCVSVSDFSSSNGSSLQMSSSSGSMSGDSLDLPPEFPPWQPSRALAAKFYADQNR